MNVRPTVIVVAFFLTTGFLATRSMDLRADETAHYEQIESYIAGEYVTTTTTTGGFHAGAMIFAHLTGLTGKEGIRLFVVLISAATVLAFGLIARSPELGPGSLRTLQFFFFPQLFPFWFLIYTDVYALMFLLLAILALTRERFHVSGALITLSLIVRQTYVVWLGMLGLWTAMVSLDQPRGRLVRRCASFALGSTIFVLFVIRNGGIAVGDTESHPDFAIQTENLLYMLFCFFFLFLPLNIAKLPRILRLHPALIAGVGLASFGLFFGTFRVDHPYNTQWQDFFLRNALLEAITATTAAGVVVSLAIALAVLSLCVIRLRRPIHYLVYPFAVLSVVPSSLIEQRYYIPAFALFMLFRESESPAVELATLGLNVVLALYLFNGVARGWFFL